MVKRIFRGKGLLLLFVAILAFGFVRGSITSKENDRKKARHYFLEGAIKESEGRDDEAYEYYKRAYLLDTTYADAASNYGAARVFLNTDILSKREQKLQGLKIAKKYLDSHPGDVFATLQYGYMAQVTDTFPEAIRVYEEYGKHDNSNVTVILTKAEVYGVMEQYDSAVNAIKHFERIRGASAESTLQKIRYLLLAKDTAGIMNELADLLAANPTNADYPLLKAKVWEVLEEPDSSFYYIKLAEKVAPDAGKVKNELAGYYAAQGDSVNYDKYTYEALMSEDLELEVKLNILSNYMQKIISEKSDTKRSDTLFNTLREQYPHEPSILELGAQYSAAKKDWSSAIEQMTYAIDLDPQNPDYYSGLMTYYLISERPKDAMEIFDRAKKEDVPFMPATYVLYANAAEALKQYDRAEATYDSLLNLMAPGVSLKDEIDLDKLRHLDWTGLYMVSSYFEMAGDMYYKMDNTKEAFRTYENALKIYPDNPLTLNNYAYFLIESGDSKPGTENFVKAKEMSKKALDLTENDPVSTYLDTYAWILFKEGNYKEAEDYQEKAFETLEKEGNEPTYDFFSHYGDILFMNGKPQEALKQWEKALELEPTDKLLQKKVKNKTFYYE